MSLEYLTRQVGYHKGSVPEFLQRYGCAAEAALRAPVADFRDFAENLLGWIGDERNLRIAWEYLAQYGGPAAGPNGRTWTDYNRVDTFTIFRVMGEVIRSGEYQHGPLLRRKIPKRPGSDQRRTLLLANIEDRLVARAALQILEPLLDPQFHYHTFCRRLRGPLLALAHAQKCSQQDGRFLWIAEDFKDAFDHVPHGRLLDIVRCYLPSTGVRKLVRGIISNDRREGLPQGSPISPLLMNVYLHHVLDRKWRKKHPDVPLLRYLDDTLLVCGPGDDVQSLYSDFAQVATSAGMRLKHGYNKALTDIRITPADWLGYQVRAGRSGFEIRTRMDAAEGTEGDAWLDKLYDKLLQLHDRPDAPLFVPAVMQGFVNHAGPALPFTDTRRAYDRIAAVAGEAAFEEIPSHGSVRMWWERAYERWQRILDESIRGQEPVVEIPA